MARHVFPPRTDHQRRHGDPLLATADLERGEEATFFARHALLFHGHPSDKWLESLASHADWRVRAALAEGLLTEPTSHHRLAAPVVRQLAADDDYKVRAAVARAIARVPLAGWAEQFEALIADDNWHVRASMLRGLRHRGLLSIGSGGRTGETATAASAHRLTDEEN